jgi:hypothetical protein
LTLPKESKTAQLPLTRKAKVLTGAAVFGVAMLVSMAVLNDTQLVDWSASLRLVGITSGIWTGIGIAFFVIFRAIFKALRERDDFLERMLLRALIIGVAMVLLYMSAVSMRFVYSDIIGLNEFDRQWNCVYEPDWHNYCDEINLSAFEIQYRAASAAMASVAFWAGLGVVGMFFILTAISEWRYRGSRP